MNILSVSKEKNEAVVRLDSNELVALCNALYQATKADNVRSIIYQLYGNFILARDLSQYGHIDAFCYEKIGECREMVKKITESEVTEEK